MILEVLLGHLHEDVIGAMRGNVRAPEPRRRRGESAEVLHLETNPFPGADIVQPPQRIGDVPRFHQVKSKTGSAKGGDGQRLGLQLALLRETYGGRIYYDALVGNTLRGHRSRAAVERAAPGVAVLVGEAAFHELTGSAVGPQLLLRTYQAAFRHMADLNGYSIPEVSERIVIEFQERASREGDQVWASILEHAIGGGVAEQDSRYCTS